MNSNRTRLYQLHRVVFSISQGNLSVTAYFTKLKTVWKEYLRLCGSTEESNGVFHDQLVITFLMGLNETNKAVRAKILQMNPPPSLNDVYDLVLKEEQQRGVIANIKLNLRPVIGILSTPFGGSKKDSYIAASYVRFVQSAGARVIPLIYNEPRDTLLKKLSLVNGVLFIGGVSMRPSYLEIVELIYEYVKERKKVGQHFPCYAICLGFELLLMIISGCKAEDILEEYAANEQASKLEFRKDVDLAGTVFQRFPPELIDKLGNEKLVAQNHSLGISEERLTENSELKKFFDILTTSADKNGKVYVSTVQAKEYPITGFQWHPEKSAFEWVSMKYPHSEDSILVMQLVANFFISEARKSSFPRDERALRNKLIYKHTPTYSGVKFDELYRFPKPRDKK